MNFRASGEVREFMRTLAPEPRRILSQALRNIAAGKAAMEVLDSPLERFYRVRVGRFRIICAVEGNTVYALFAEQRATVYEVASAAFLERVLISMRD